MAAAAAEEEEGAVRAECRGCRGLGWLIDRRVHVCEVVQRAFEPFVPLRPLFSIH